MFLIDIFNDWLATRDEFTLKMILFCCGIGLLLTLTYLVCSVAEEGFRITRSRRRWW
jgi:hypothetical protein